MNNSVKNKESLLPQPAGIFKIFKYAFLKQTGSKPESRCICATLADINS